jgi:hypothetical protein
VKGEIVSDRYKGSNISPLVSNSTKVCHLCMASLPEARMTIVHPVPGLTMYCCPTCAEQRNKTLAAILAYANKRWLWDDAPMLEELFERYGIDSTPEAFVDSWAHHYDLSDPRDVGL